MATRTSTAHCVKCGKERATFKCAGCLQDFCFNHLTDHRQELNMQLDEIEINRDLVRQSLNEQAINPKNYSLIKQIDKWEEDSIKIIQKTATECRQHILQYATKHINQIEIILNKLTDQLRQTRQENDFNEIHLNQFKQKLTQLAKELDKPSNISLEQDSTSLINKISVVVSVGKCLSSI
jgi:hypothetical protein